MPELPPTEHVDFEPIVTPVLGPKGLVVGHLRMEFGGEIRRCQPYDPDSTCPSCSTVRGPAFTVGRFNVGRRRHKMTVQDEQFVQRVCRSCGMLWRELNTKRGT